MAPSEYKRLRLFHSSCSRQPSWTPFLNRNARSARSNEKGAGMNTGTPAKDKLTPRKFALGQKSVHSGFRTPRRVQANGDSDSVLKRVESAPPSTKTSEVEMRIESEELDREIASFAWSVPVITHRGFPFFIISLIASDGSQDECVLDKYIDALHAYNEVKDACQVVLGQIAVHEGTTVRTVHERFGLTDAD
eukprot:m.92667 g.92667  ORF g.92667 m.92667 type:complete len:192 (+) comp8517_c1_seq3:1125-1700(+)